jgi:hypothetical protein
MIISVTILSIISATVLSIISATVMLITLSNIRLRGARFLRFPEGVQHGSDEVVGDVLVDLAAVLRHFRFRHPDLLSRLKNVPGSM